MSQNNQNIIDLDSWILEYDSHLMEDITKEIELAISFPLSEKHTAENFIKDTFSPFIGHSVLKIRAEKGLLVTDKNFSLRNMKEFVDITCRKKVVRDSDSILLYMSVKEAFDIPFEDLPRYLVSDDLVKKVVSRKRLELGIK